ncbi:Hypothetical predicted protein [Cloeon dipterum]|uniref:Uncharacterized protein n=1 Tax=Cloeon dipterum TaxID=197152 RepID=A0A8S1BT37_9INSE|nr:Hypothetical predicted protein [Cloeon dipterum]
MRNVIPRNFPCQESSKACTGKMLRAFGVVFIIHFIWLLDKGVAGSDLTKNEMPKATNCSFAEDCSINLTGDECTIESFAFRNHFLTMKSSWWYYKYAALESGNPRAAKNWKWGAVWSIAEINVEGEILYLFKDQRLKRYLSFNRQMYSYLRGESNPRMMDNLWRIARVGVGGRVTLQKHLPPREYLHASQHTKSGDQQLEMHAEPHAKSSQWLVRCEKS